MKWFKHMANMRNDLFIKKLRRNFGLEGYALWNLILEIYADECGSNPEGPIVFDIEVLCDELGIKRPTLERLVAFCVLHEKWVASTRGPAESYPALGQGSELILEIPKMQELCDEWTSRKNKNSGVTPAKNKEEEKEVTPLAPQGGHFKKRRRRDVDPSVNTTVANERRALEHKKALAKKLLASKKIKNIFSQRVYDTENLYSEVSNGKVFIRGPDIDPNLDSACHYFEPCEEERNG